MPWRWRWPLMLIKPQCMPESILRTIHLFLPASLLVRDSGYSFFREKKTEGCIVSRWSSGIWAYRLTPLATVLCSLFLIWSKLQLAPLIACLKSSPTLLLAGRALILFGFLCFSEKTSPVHFSLSESWFIWANHGVLFPLVKNLVRQRHFTRFWPRDYEG